MSKKIFFGFLALLSVCIYGWENASADQDTLTAKRFAVQLLSGPLFSPVIDHGREELNYVQTDLRICWILDPEKTAEKINLGGYFEFIFELTYSAVFEGPGSYLSGITSLFRYNFLSKRRFLVPYIQLGAGIVYNDIYKDDSQTLIGQSVEFTPQASIGLRYFQNDSWSLDVEVIFHHISNAGLAERNLGTNALGAIIGFSFFF